MTGAGEEILETRDGAVALLQIRRGPDNYVDLALIAALADRLEALDRDAEVRASVMSSEGRNFCAGVRLAPPGDGAESAGPAALYREAVRLFRTRKPVVAAVQGAAVGAGLGLALACDFRVAAPRARFSANFTRIGFHPGFALTHTLPRLVGPQKAALMFLTGRRLDAETALAFGLVDTLVLEEALLPAAIALAGEIGEAAPLAIEATRAELRRGLAEAAEAAMAAEAEAQAALMQTEDFREGLRAVAERRPGRFQRR